MPRDRLATARFAVLGLTVTCLTGGPVISAVYAKSRARAQRPVKPTGRAGPNHSERSTLELVAPQVAKPIERTLETPQETLAAEIAPVIQEVPTGWISPIIAVEGALPTASPPFDALAPPVEVC